MYIYVVSIDYMLAGSPLFYQDTTTIHLPASILVFLEGGIYVVISIIQTSIIQGQGAGVTDWAKAHIIRHNRKVSDNQMNFDSVHDMIEFRDPDKYKKDFVKYLERTQKKTFNIIGEDINLTLPYKHRWAKCYRKGVLSKFIALGLWAKRHNLSCGMLSLTSAQTGFTDFEILERFQESWYQLSGNLRKMNDGGRYQYIMLYEPHESGIPHIHALIFGECSQDHMNRLEKLWHDKYEMGGKGIDFDFSAGLKENIQSIVNYLMKYMSKTIVSDIINNEKLIRFHALFFQTGSRLFTSSRYLSFIMKKHRTIIHPIQAIFCEDAEIFNKYTSRSFPCKYQQIDGVKYKYELLPFEIKSKKERKYPFESWGWQLRSPALWFEMQKYI